jgi:hypothetical protein
MPRSFKAEIRSVSLILVRLPRRLAAGHAERFPELAEALVRDKASVIVASGDAAVRAAQQATKTIPIIAVVDDIVAARLINSLARPGGNTTGVSILATELDGKRASSAKPHALQKRTPEAHLYQGNPLRRSARDFSHHEVDGGMLLVGCRST